MYLEVFSNISTHQDSLRGNSVEFQITLLQKYNYISATLFNVSRCDYMVG